MLNIFINNALINSIVSLVNFCNEFCYFNNKKLKFWKKMPINKLESNTSSRYVFKALRH